MDRGTGDAPNGHSEGTRGVQQSGLGGQQATTYVCGLKNTGFGFIHQRLGGD